MFLVVLFAFAGWIVAGSSTPATLTINDSWPGTLVHSDGFGSYSDHTLSSANPCVTAYAYSTGLFFIYMDYNPAFGSTGDCESALGIEGTTEDRTYSLTFPESSICTALGLGTAPCTLVTDNNARIRADDLFGNNASSTTAGFLFKLGRTSYTLHTHSNATITGSGTSRTATYNGNVSLMTVPVTGQKSKQVGTSFYCPFQFTVTD
jgi:hypothetical protein